MLKCERIFESPQDAHYFFGYFNTPQVSADGQLILALRCANIDEVPGPESVAEVGYFDRTDNRFTVIGTTRSYNWQQGCMLQFIGPDFASRILYNDFDGERYVSKIYSMVDGATEIVPHAIYAVYRDGRTALTLDFERHYWCRRGYSYGNIVNEDRQGNVVDGDGIYEVDLETGTRQTLITTEAMVDLTHLNTMDGAVHYLEHMLPSPDGSRFVFLHRWKPREGGIHSRLCVSDRDGKAIRILNDSGRMSHFCWISDTELVGYGGKSNAVNALRRSRVLVKHLFKPILPIYHRLVKDNSSISKALTGDGYLHIDVEREAVDSILPELASEDGHPVFVEPLNSIVTDTYAKSRFDQGPQLIVASLGRSTHEIIDTLASIPEFDESPVRCDLHPRWTPGTNIVSIDTMDRGVRGVYAYEITRE